MTRRFDKERAAILLAYTGDNIGLRFGAAVIKCNLPLAYVAELFSLTRNTVDSWFAGKPVREKYHLTMNKYIDRFNADYEAAKLPCRTLKKSRQYIEELKMEIYGRPRTTEEVLEAQGIKCMAIGEVLPEMTPEMTSEMVYRLSAGKHADIAASEEQ